MPGSSRHPSPSSITSCFFYFTWRPSSPDPGDEMVIDCALNASALLVSSNVCDFRLAQQTLGLRVATPVQFLALLADSLED